MEELLVKIVRLGLYIDFKPWENPDNAFKPKGVVIEIGRLRAFIRTSIKQEIPFLIKGNEVDKIILAGIVSRMLKSLVESLDEKDKI